MGQGIDFAFREPSQEAKVKSPESNKRLDRRTPYVEKEEICLTIKNPKELFVTLLSDARQGTERSIKIYQEISQAAQDPDIKEALESRSMDLRKGPERDRPLL